MTRKPRISPNGLCRSRVDKSVRVAAPRQFSVAILFRIGEASRAGLHYKFRMEDHHLSRELVEKFCSVPPQSSLTTGDSLRANAMPLSRNTRKVSFSMMLAVGSSGGLKGTQLVLTTYQPYLWRKEEGCQSPRKNPMIAPKTNPGRILSSPKSDPTTTIIR